MLSEGATGWSDLGFSLEGLSDKNDTHLKTEAKKNASLVAIDKIEHSAGRATTHWKVSR